MGTLSTGEVSRADPIQVPVICARRNHRPDRPGPAVADTGERPRRRADRSRRPGMPGLAGADRSAPASRAALPRGTLPSPEGRRFHPLSARSAASVGAQRARARQTPASSPIGRHEASVLRPSQPETVRRSESLPAERRLQRAHAGRDGTSSPVTTKCSGLAQLLSPGSVKHTLTGSSDTPGSRRHTRRACSDDGEPPAPRRSAWRAVLQRSEAGDSTAPPRGHATTADGRGVAPPDNSMG